MSGPYHVHEGNALHSTSLSFFQKAKQKLAGNDYKSTFPIDTFKGTEIRFKEGTDWGDVKILKGMYKIVDDKNNSTYYEVLFTNLGSGKTLSEKYEGMKRHQDFASYIGVDARR